MKLIFCPLCKDVRRIKNMKICCSCGKSWGIYLDDLQAEYGGEAVPLGFENSSFVGAIKNQPERGVGRRFDSFVIPRECDTYKKVK